LIATPPAPRSDLRPRAQRQRAERLLTAGRCFSWIVLLGIPAISLGVAAAALLGSIDLDPMWITSALILAVVFLHGAYYVRRDETQERREG
jgi:hypothetical protein